MRLLRLGDAVGVSFGARLAAAARTAAFGRFRGLFGGLAGAREGAFNGLRNGGLGLDLNERLGRGRPGRLLGGARLQRFGHVGRFRGLGTLGALRAVGAAAAARTAAAGAFARLIVVGGGRFDGVLTFCLLGLLVEGLLSLLFESLVGLRLGGLNHRGGFGSRSGLSGGKRGVNRRGFHRFGNRRLHLGLLGAAALTATARTAFIVGTLDLRRGLSLGDLRGLDGLDGLRFGGYALGDGRGLRAYVVRFRTARTALGALPAFRTVGALEALAAAAARAAFSLFGALGGFTALAAFRTIGALRAFAALRAAAAATRAALTALAAFGALTAARAGAAAAFGLLLGLDGGLRLFGLLLLLGAEEEVEHAAQEGLTRSDGLELLGAAGFGLGGLFGLLGLRFGLMHRGGFAFNDVLDHRNLLRTRGLVLLGLLRVRVVRLRLDLLDEVEARHVRLEALVVLTDALDVVVRRLEEGVRDEDDRDAVARLELGDVVALFVQEEGRHVNGHLSLDGARAFLHRLLLEDAQDLDGRGLGVADDADAVAARAGDVVAFGERGAQALARELHQAEAADLGDLHAGAVVADRVLEALLDGALVLGLGHVDEVDHDEAAQVAQTHLAGHFIGGFAVGAEGRVLDVGAAGGARRVDVDRDERLRVVDHDRAARGKRNRAGVGRLDLLLDLEAREERDVVAVALDAVHHVGHHVRHELAGLLVDLVGVDEDLADLGLEVVADRAHDEVGFLNDEEGRRIEALAGATVHRRLVVHLVVLLAVHLDHVVVLRTRGVGDRLPELQEVVEVPLQLLGRAADAGGAGDRGHARGELELVHRFAKLLTLLTLDAAGNAARAGVVRHQNEVAAREADEGREGGALVAALLLLDLDDELLALADRLLDGRHADVDALGEVGARDFLEGQEPVALLAVVDEARFERGLDAGDDALVDVGLARLAARGLNVDVDQLLTIDDADARFLGVRGIEKHALHLGGAPSRPVEGRGREACRTQRLWRGRRFERFDAVPCAETHSQMKRMCPKEGGASRRTLRPPASPPSSRRAAAAPPRSRPMCRARDAAPFKKARQSRSLWGESRLHDWGRSST